MIDKINNPQSKLQQQFQQANMDLNKPIEFQRPGQLQTTVPQGDLPQPQVSDQPEVGPDQQQLQQEQKKGFKALLQQAKQKAIDEGKKYLMEKITGGQDDFNQPQQDNQQPGSRQLQEPPKADLPETSRPTANRPDTSNRPKPQSPVQGPPKAPKMPRLKAPPKPRLR